MSAVITPTVSAANTGLDVMVATVSLREVALARFTLTEFDLLVLAEKYRDCVYDVSTLKGLGEAKAARFELRESGRYAVQRVRDAAKAELNDLKGTVDAEAERLIAILAGTEDAIDRQIKAREQQLADEKAERERREEAERQAEVERKARHAGELAKIRGYVMQCHGKGTADLERALATLNPLCDTFDAAAWDEFAPEAAEAWASTLEAIGTLLIDAKARDAAAALVEAQRIKNERVATDLAERQRKMDEQAAELARQQAALQQAQQNSQRQESGAQTGSNAENMAHPTDDAAPVGGPAEGEATVSAAASPVLSSPPSQDEPPPVAPPVGAKRVITIDLGDTKPIDLPPPVAPPTLRLGAIMLRLGFKVDAAFLTALGFAPASRNGAAVMYHEHDFQALCAALAEHVLKVGEKHQ